MVNLLPPRPPSAPPADPLLGETRALLSRRLDDVRLWWALRPARLPVADRLRTPELEPELEEEPSLAALEEAVGTLAERRARRLADSPPARAGAHASGRLLVCEVNVSVGDGRAEAHSEGLFDVDDRPPWDGWLVSFGRTHPSQPADPVECLICWVPEPLVSLAAAGIAANESGCIYWVGDRDDGLSPDLAGIVGG